MGHELCARLLGLMLCTFELVLPSRAVERHSQWKLTESKKNQGAWIEAEMDSSRFLNFIDFFSSGPTFKRLLILIHAVLGTFQNLPE